MLIAMNHYSHFKKSLHTLLLSCLLFFLVVTSTFSATQGLRATSSTGTIDIALNNNVFALIFGLDDIDLGTWSGSGDMSANEDICVAFNGTGPRFFGQTDNYLIRATGDGTPGNPGAFTLSNGVEAIDYRVILTDLNNQIELTAGNITTGQILLNPGYNANIAALAGGFASACINPNATITVLIEEAELAAGSGTHTGTLTLELAPE